MNPADTIVSIEQFGTVLFRNAVTNVSNEDMVGLEDEVSVTAARNAKTRFTKAAQKGDGECRWQDGDEFK